MKNLLIALSLLISVNSHATLIELSFDQDSYGQNDVITGQLIASDLSYTLGGFASTIAFDDSQLALTGFTFGNGFDDGLGSYSFGDDSIAGSLFLEDYADAWADEMTIATNQGTSFVLASFTFTALSAGLNTVSLLAGSEVVSFDNAMLDTLGAHSASFDVTAVPTPMTGVLFATCLLLMRRKLV